MDILDGVRVLFLLGRLKTKDSERVLNKFDKAVLHKDGKIDRLYKLKFSLLAPSAGAFLITNSRKMKVNFSWETSKKNKLQSFEISKKSNFKNILLKRKTLRTSVDINLGESTYYWRIKAKNKISKNI